MDGALKNGRPAGAERERRDEQGQGKSTIPLRSSPSTSVQPVVSETMATAGMVSPMRRVPSPALD